MNTLNPAPAVSRKRPLASLLLATLAAVTLQLLAGHAAQAAIPETVTSGARQIVLVPGAYVDGGSLRQLHDQLWLKGYQITVVQQPNTSLEANVAAVRRALASIDGPVVLVGHDLGGVTISVAGADPKVAALVYVAALQPEQGETARTLLAGSPAAHPLSLDWKVTSDGYVSIDPAKFAALYSGDLPPNRTNFLKIAQAQTSAAVFDAPATAAAWHNKPSYAVVATEDLIIDPHLQRRLYGRAKAKITEVKGSHAVMISQPEQVAKVVREAALDVKTN